MSKITGATLLGAASILLLAGLGVSETPASARQQALALPAIAADAARADEPRECDAAAVTTRCIY